MSAEMTQAEIDAMLNSMANGEDPAAAAPAPSPSPVAATTVQNNSGSDSGGLSQAEIDAMLSGNSSPPVSPVSSGATTSAPQVVTPVTSGDGAVNMSFQSLGGQGGTKGNHDVSMIMDVPLELTVELGRTNMFIKDILDLGLGSVVEINRLAGEPIELLVNGKVIAKGEVVVIDERFGIRITQLLNPVNEASLN